MAEIAGLTQRQPQNPLFKENCKNPYSMREKGIPKIKYELSHYTGYRP
jgi:hypothetical protein